MDQALLIEDGTVYGLAYPGLGIAELEPLQRD